MVEFSLTPLHLCSGWTWHGGLARMCLDQKVQPTWAFVGSALISTWQLAGSWTVTARRPLADGLAVTPNSVLQISIPAGTHLTSLLFYYAVSLFLSMTIFTWNYFIRLYIYNICTVNSFLRLFLFLIYLFGCT